MFSSNGKYTLDIFNVYHQHFRTVKKGKNTVFSIYAQQTAFFCIFYMFNSVLASFFRNVTKNRLLRKTTSDKDFFN